MKKIILVILLLLSSCASNKQIAEDKHLNNLFTNLNTPIDVPAFTASSDNVYFIDRGRIYTFDASSESAFELVTLDVIDDNPLSLESYISSDFSEYEKYSELVFPKFLQVYDDKLYYISEYFNIEGENNIKLYQLDLKGENRKEVFTFDTTPYDPIISHGTLFYRSTFSDGLFKADLNTKEIQEIDLGNDYAFLDYVVSNDRFGANLYNTLDRRVSLSYYDFDKQEFYSDTEQEFPFYSSIYDEVSTSMIVSNDAYDTIVLKDGIESANLGKLVVDYIDENYIYTSSVEGEKVYSIFTHDGTLQKEFKSPFEFVDSSLLFEAFSDASQSNILGVFNNHLVVLGNTKDYGLNVYLINIDSEEWRLIHNGHLNVKE